MSDPYWPWWAVITFFMSGWFCAWILTVSRRPKHIECPNCENYVTVTKFRAHWKECLS